MNTATLGPWFWVHTFYGYGLLLIGFAIVAITAIRSFYIYRVQAIALLAACAAPLVVNMLYTFGIWSDGLQIFPLTIAFTGLILGWTAFRHHFLDVTPVARNTLFDIMRDGTLVVNAQGRLVDMNPAMQRILAATLPAGAAPEQMIGMPALQALAAWPEVVEALGKKADIQLEVTIGQNSNPQYFEVRLVPLPGSQQAGWLAVWHNITDRKQAEEQIRYMGTHDALTGLPSRRLVMDRLAMAVRLAHRYQKVTAVLFIDLDGFKVVNDTLGHDAGDYVLKQVAARLQACIRETDTVARLGGDEFLLLATALNTADDAKKIAQKVLCSLSDPILYNEQLANIGASIGIALYPDHGEDIEHLINLADDAMYQVKKSGKNSYILATSEILGQAETPIDG